MKDYKTVTRELLAKRDKYLEEQKECEGAKIRVRTTIALALISALLITALVFSTLAATRNLRHPANNYPHITGKDNLQSIPSSTPETGDCVISCNGVWGDEEVVYFDITVKNKNGAPIATVKEGQYIGRLDPFGHYIKFSNGYIKEIFFLLMNDSDESCIHYEARALFYENEKEYLGQDAYIHVGGIKSELYWEEYEGTDEYYKDSITETVCVFSEPLPVTITVNSAEKQVTFEDGEFEILDSGIKLTCGSISAANVHFYGVCTLEGKLYGLQDILKDACLIYDDGTTVPLGGKTDAGTLENGLFTVGWITGTLIDPERVTAIQIDGQTITID